jgi:hypothetical protein
MSILEQIRALDPVRDHQRIVFLSTRFDFPFDTTRSLEFALFRTFCVPIVSELLSRTGEFIDRAQKRYDDTDIIVSELMEWGYDSDRGRSALRRMNQLHGRFQIANADLLYVLSTFVYEPIRWNARFGWRPMCEQEKLAMFYFWRELGRRMNIKDIPEGFGAFETYNRHYERDHFRRAGSNHRVGQATVNMFACWFPRPLHPLVRGAMYALMDEPLIEGFGFPRPSRPMRWLVHGGLRARARVLRWLPSRRRPQLRTEMKHRSYPDGYHIDELGPRQAGQPGNDNDRTGE